MEFQFCCSYVIPQNAFTGRKHKEILKNVEGRVRAGELMAVMGPSGAGKSALLNILAKAQVPGVATGYMLVNGHELTSSLFKRYCAAVPQADNHWAFLTAREHLVFATALSQPESTIATKDKFVDDLLKALGMESCQHTRAGNALIRGLSGGQRRRLSVAIALCKQPSLLLLDEPTSGLDSAAASRATSYLRLICSSRNVAMICSIHQPSAMMMNDFTSVLVLSAGRTVYAGQTNELAAYVQRVHPASGSAVTELNPAEDIVQIASKDFNDAPAVDKILDAWSHSAPRLQIPLESTLPPALSPDTTPNRELFDRE